MDQPENTNANKALEVGTRDPVAPTALGTDIRLTRVSVIPAFEEGRVNVFLAGFKTFDGFQLAIMSAFGLDWPMPSFDDYQTHINANIAALNAITDPR